MYVKKYEYDYNFISCDYNKRQLMTCVTALIIHSEEMKLLQQLMIVLLVINHYVHVY